MEKTDTVSKVLHNVTSFNSKYGLMYNHEIRFNNGDSVIRIGKERVEKLELLAAWGKRNPKPIDWLSLIDIILKYR